MDTVENVTVWVAIILVVLVIVAGAAGVAVILQGACKPTTMSIAPDRPSVHAIEIIPYHGDDGTIWHSVTSPRWDLDLDDVRLYHGDTFIWTGEKLPTIKLVKYHQPPVGLTGGAGACNIVTETEAR